MLEKYVAANWINWQYVSNKTGYKKSTSEKQSISEVKMGNLQKDLKYSTICNTEYSENIMRIW